LLAAGRTGGSGGGVMGAAGPEQDSEDDDQRSDGNDSPRYFVERIFGKITLPKANIFGAGKLLFREFLDLLFFRLLFFEGAWFRRREVGGDEWPLLRRRRAWGPRALRFPDFVGIDLRLAQAGEIVGDGIFGVESEVLGVGANESLVEDAAGKLIEVFFFDGLEHARADLGDVGNVIEREVLFLACLAEFVAEFSHGVCPEITGTS